MSETGKHTPGPWEANLESDIGDYVIWGPSPNDEFIANMGTSVDEARASASNSEIIAFDVARANARLIAAAPELLAALVALTAWADRVNDASSEGGLLGDEYDDALDAISKATGQSTEGA